MPRRPPLVEASYRNTFEAGIAEQLESAGVEFDYESLKLQIAYPPRLGKYTPDFIPQRCTIIIEGKGYFYDSAKDRQKLVLAKEQHPELDIRLCFQKASTKIYKGSKTTYAKWAEDHGFKWCEKVIPPAWITEIKEQQNASKRGSPNACTSARGSRTSRKEAKHHASRSSRPLQRTASR